MLSNSSLLLNVFFQRLINISVLHKDYEITKQNLPQKFTNTYMKSFTLFRIIFRHKQFHKTLIMLRASNTQINMENL